MPTLPIPSRFREFTVEAFLANGLSGEVYKARTRDGKFVALKLFAKNKERDRTVFGYFANEQLLLREVTRHSHHPHIVDYVSSNLATSPYFLATRYISGSRSLSSLLGRPLPPGFVLRVVTQIASALDYLHCGHPTFSPIVHRDVTPNNVLIDQAGNAVLIDLSIARHPAYASPEERGLGTPQYMAAEQYVGAEVPATDQFALAAVALHMLVGRALLSPNPQAAQRKLDALHTSQSSDIGVQLGSRTRTAVVIARAMAYNPAERYASCAQFAERLRQALQEDRQTIVDDAPPSRPLLRSYRGHLIMAFAGIMAPAALFTALWNHPWPPTASRAPNALAHPTTRSPQPTVELIPSPTALPTPTVASGLYSPPQPTVELIPSPTTLPTPTVAPSPPGNLPKAAWVPLPSVTSTREPLEKSNPWEPIAKDSK